MLKSVSIVEYNYRLQATRVEDKDSRNLTTAANNETYFKPTILNYSRA